MTEILQFLTVVGVAFSWWEALKAKSTAREGVAVSREVRTQTNGMLTRFEALAKSIGHYEGVAEEKARHEHEHEDQ